MIATCPSPLTASMALNDPSQARTPAYFPKCPTPMLTEVAGFWVEGLILCGQLFVNNCDMSDTILGAKVCSSGMSDTSAVGIESGAAATGRSALSFGPYAFH